MKIGSVTVDSKDRVKVRASVASAALMLCGCTEFLQNRGISKSSLLQMVPLPAPDGPESMKSLPECLPR